MSKFKVVVQNINYVGKDGKEKSLVLDTHAAFDKKDAEQICEQMGINKNRINFITEEIKLFDWDKLPGLSKKPL